MVGRRAQVIAAACAACSGFALATGHFVTTTTFDLLSTTVLCWLMIRAVTRRSGPSLLAAGVVAGLGCEAKPQVALVAAVMLAALDGGWPAVAAALAVAAGRRRRGPGAGGAIRDLADQRTAGRS